MKKVLLGMLAAASITGAAQADTITVSNAGWYDVIVQYVDNNNARQKETVSRGQTVTFDTAWGRADVRANCSGYGWNSDVDLEATNVLHAYGDCWGGARFYWGKQ